MMKIIDDLVQFRLLGKILEGTVASEVRDARDSGWQPPLVAGVRDAAEKYIKMASRFARYLGVLAFIPLVFVAKVLVQNQQYNGFGVGYAVWLSIVGIFAMWLFFPLFVIVPPLRELPENDYRELLRPLWINLEIFYILISAGLFAHIYPSWIFSTTLPIWALIVLLWLFAPWAVYLAKLDGIFIKLRLIQLGILIAGTLLIVASPVPMKHFQWWAQREVANKIRPVEQKEITANWAALQWFTQEGAPNVWYSFSVERGYHLFAAPGHDTDTNQPLKPVTDKATKDTIVAAFNEQKKAQEEQAVLKNQKRLTELEAQKQQATLDSQRELAELAAQNEKRNVETRERLIRENVFPSAVNAATTDRPLALIALDARQLQDFVLTDRISKLLSAGGLRHETVVFTPTFLASPAFQEILMGNQSRERSFHPEDFASHVLVIQPATTISTQNPVNGVEMLAADTIWTVRLISLSDYRIEDSEEIKVRGVGFKESDAKNLAIERASVEMQKRLSIIRAKLAPAKYP